MKKLIPSVTDVNGASIQWLFGSECCCNKPMTTPQVTCCDGTLLVLNSYGKVAALVGQELVPLNVTPQMNFLNFKCGTSPYRFELYEGHTNLGRVYYTPPMSVTETVIEENVYSYATSGGYFNPSYSKHYGVFFKSPSSNPNDWYNSFVDTVVYYDGIQIGSVTVSESDYSHVTDNYCFLKLNHGYSPPYNYRVFYKGQDKGNVELKDYIPAREICGDFFGFTYSGVFWQGNLVDADLGSPSDASYSDSLYSIKRTVTGYIQNAVLYYKDVQIADITSGGTNYYGATYVIPAIGFCIVDFPASAEKIGSNYVTHMEKRLYVRNTLYATGNYDLVSEYGFTNEGTPQNVTGFIGAAGNSCNCDMYWFQVNYADGSSIWLNQDGVVNGTPPSGTCCGDMIRTSSGTVYDKNGNIVIDKTQMSICCGGVFFSFAGWIEEPYIDVLSLNYGLMRFDLETFARIDGNAV